MSCGAFDLSALNVSDPVTSAKGTKTAALSCGGKPIIWQPEAQTVVFEPSAFQNPEATRVNLIMHASTMATQTLNAIDQEIIAYCTEHSARLFGKVMSHDEVANRYCPCLKHAAKEGYEPTFKAKILLSGRGQLKCWGNDKTLRHAPETWIGCAVQPRLALRCLWIMPKEFGCLFECSDVMLTEAEESCPF